MNVKQVHLKHRMIFLMIFVIVGLILPFTFNIIDFDFSSDRSVRGFIEALPSLLIVEVISVVILGFIGFMVGYILEMIFEEK